MANQLITKRRLQQGIVQYALITLLIAVLGGYFGYMHYSEYQSATVAFEKETQTLGQLKAAAEKANNDYKTLKNQMDQTNSGVNEAIEKVLPSNEAFTDLARELDKYFLNTRASSNPMFLSDLRFNASRVEDGNDYSTLPFSMNISGDEDGFKQFLDYLAKTGDLNDKSRLLNLASIALSYQQPTINTEEASATNFPSETVPGEIPTAVPSSLNSTVPQVSATLNLDAYFQKPIDNGNTPAN